jgi:hypothetical protein
MGVDAARRRTQFPKLLFKKLFPVSTTATNNEMCRNETRIVNDKK